MAIDTTKTVTGLTYNGVELPMAGGGTSDHRLLSHRSDDNQHPMSAITGLVNALSGKADKLSIKTTIDAVATVNTQYILGQQSSVSIVMPTTAAVGDTIIVIFSSGATAANLTCDLVGFDFVPKANKTNKIVFELLDTANDTWAVEVMEG